MFGVLRLLFVVCCVGVCGLLIVVWRVVCVVRCVLCVACRCCGVVVVVVVGV